MDKQDCAHSEGNLVSVCSRSVCWKLSTILSVGMVKEVGLLRNLQVKRKGTHQKEVPWVNVGKERALKILAGI